MNRAILSSVLMMVAIATSWAQPWQQTNNEFGTEDLLGLSGDQVSAMYNETPISSFYSEQLTIPSPLKDMTARDWTLHTFERNPYFMVVDQTGNQLPYIDNYVSPVVLGVVVPVLIEVVKEVCGNILLKDCIVRYRHSHDDHLNHPGHDPEHKPSESHEHQHVSDHNHAHNH